MFHDYKGTLMVTYTVKFKKVGSLFSHKVKRVKGDFIASDVEGKPRVLILENESRIEVPTVGMIFEFSFERFLLIKQRMESESGQNITTV
jgi:hypothetical protein